MNLTNKLFGQIFVAVVFTIVVVGTLFRFLCGSDFQSFCIKEIALFQPVFVICGVLVAFGIGWGLFKRSKYRLLYSLFYVLINALIAFGYYSLLINQSNNVKGISMSLLLLLTVGLFFLFAYLVPKKYKIYRGNQIIIKNVDIYLMFKKGKTLLSLLYILGFLCFFILFTTIVFLFD